MSDRTGDLEAQIRQELAKHSYADAGIRKTYCECGVILRKGQAELATHRAGVEQKLREKLNRG